MFKAMRTMALLSVLLLAMLAACQPVQPGNSAMTPVSKPIDISSKPVAFQPADALLPEVSDALSGFSLDLFKRVVAAEDGKNVFISPLSVWLALGMAYNGASGSTAEGMTRALHASGVTIDDLNKSNAGLLGVLANADKNVKIAVANSIWIQKGFDGAVNKGFLDVNKSSYGAKISALDFSKAGAADAINAWVKGQTGGKIGKMIDGINIDAEMYLINAIYFNARWRYPFDPKLTRDGEFAISDSKTVRAKFMVSPGYENKLGCVSHGVCAVRLPYASGRLEMAAVMPYEQPFDVFVKGLTAEQLQTDIDQCGTVNLELTFPKFMLEYGVGLDAELKAMGMQDAFDSSADFSNLSSTMGKEISISEILHKAFIDVNEAGTEAGAATEEMMVAATMPPQELEFTKPFLYLIRDTKTGAILFIGAMLDPS